MSNIEHYLTAEQDESEVFIKIIMIETMKKT